MHAKFCGCISWEATIRKKGDGRVTLRCTLLWNWRDMDINGRELCPKTEFCVICIYLWDSVTRELFILFVVVTAILQSLSNTTFKEWIILRQMEPMVAPVPDNTRTSYASVITSLDLSLYVYSVICLSFILFLLLHGHITLATWR